jgi:hypothetical protein
MPQSKVVMATNTETGLLSFHFPHPFPFSSHFFSAKQIIMKPEIFQKNDGVTMDGKRTLNVSRFIGPLQSAPGNLKSLV